MPVCLEGPAYQAVAYIEWHIPDDVLIKLDSLMMGTGLLETCREGKWINTLKKIASSWLLTRITVQKPAPSELIQPYFLIHCNIHWIMYRYFHSQQDNAVAISIRCVYLWWQVQHFPETGCRTADAAHDSVACQILPQPEMDQMFVNLL